MNLTSQVWQGMALQWTKQIPFIQWFPMMIFSIIPFAACLYILGRERQSRRERTFQTPSKYLSFFSYLCITLGPFAVIAVALQNLNGICYILKNVANSLLYSQFIAMESFQLCRLHYSFSRERVHSDKGYPKWVFQLMFTVLVIWTLYGFVVTEQLCGMTIGCGIQVISNSPGLSDFALC